MVAVDGLRVVGARPREVWLTFGLAVLLHVLLVTGVLLVPRFRIGAYITVPVTYTVSLVPDPSATRGGPAASAPAATTPPATAPVPAPPAPAVRSAPTPRPAPPSEELTLPGRRPARKAPADVEPSLRPPGASPRREEPRPGPSLPAPSAPPAAVAPPVAAPIPGPVAAPGAEAGKGVGVEIKGSGAGSGGTVQDYYLTLVKYKIEEAWNLLAVSVPPEASVVVRLKILRSGLIKDIEVETSSGLAVVDNIALRAIRQSQPLPPFPNLLAEPSLEVKLRFVMDNARRGA